MFKFRSKSKNKEIKIKCNRHKKGLGIFGQMIYNLYDKNGKIIGVGCWRCFKNLPIYQEKTIDK